MRNNKGFSFVESLAAASLLMMIITTLVPAASILFSERMSIEQSQVIRHTLHEELQPYVHGGDRNLPNKMSRSIKGTNALFQFSKQDDLVKGCVTWENANKRKDRFCLYGYPEK